MLACSVTLLNETFLPKNQTHKPNTLFGDLKVQNGFKSTSVLETKLVKQFEMLKLMKTLQHFRDSRNASLGASAHLPACLLALSATQAAATVSI